MRRFLSRIGLNQQFFRIAEASLVMLFFVQALRYLIGAMYSRIASASYAARFPAEMLGELASKPGYVPVEVVSQEITLLVYLLALPVVAVLIGRFPVFLLLAALATAAGRVLMLADVGITVAASASLTVGVGLLYIVLIAHHRYRTFPIMFIIAFAADQLIRAAGDTVDLTWSQDFFLAQLILFFVTVILAVVNYFGQRSTEDKDRGLLTFWGGLGFGAVLFLELALLGLPNAVAGRAGIDYTLTVPLLIAATLLPLLAASRSVARRVIGLFDASVRGWVWLLLLSLMLVLGTRFTGIVAGIGFVVAQFAISMIWWWMVRPRAEDERNFGGLWLLMGTLIFVVLVVFDIFTYEYAYVYAAQTTIPTLTNILNAYVIPLLRGFRGLGYAIILIAALVATLPIVQTQRRIAWRGGDGLARNLLTVVGVVGATVGGAYLAAPPLVASPAASQSLWVGTYNIHGGYTEFFAPNLEGVVEDIQRSGADVMLLQEVEAGRLTSFGVDQPLWLARQLGWDVRFYPANEGLQGLAILSETPILFGDGQPLVGVGQQTALQRVQVQPQADTIVTVYNTWLGLLVETPEQTIEEQEQDQQRQLNDIVTIINNHHPNRQLGYTVMGGTFNNIPDSPLIERVDAVGFNDPFAGSPIERSATLARVGLEARVDYVWIYPDVAEGVGVIESDASDHQLAFVSISLPE